MILQQHPWSTKSTMIAALVGALSIASATFAAAAFQLPSAPRPIPCTEAGVPAGCDPTILNTFLGDMTIAPFVMAEGDEVTFTWVAFAGFRDPNATDNPPYASSPAWNNVVGYSFGQVFGSIDCVPHTAACSVRVKQGGVAPQPNPDGSPGTATWRLISVNIANGIGPASEQRHIYIQPKFFWATFHIVDDDGQPVTPATGIKMEFTKRAENGAAYEGETLRNVLLRYRLYQLSPAPAQQAFAAANPALAGVFLDDPIPPGPINVPAAEKLVVNGSLANDTVTTNLRVGTYDVVVTDTGGRYFEPFVLVVSDDNIDDDVQAAPDPLKVVDFRAPELVDPREPFEVEIDVQNVGGVDANTVRGQLALQPVPFGLSGAQVLSTTPPSVGTLPPGDIATFTVLIQARQGGQLIMSATGRGTVGGVSVRSDPVERVTRLGSDDLLATLRFYAPNSELGEVRPDITTDPPSQIIDVVPGDRVEIELVAMNLGDTELTDVTPGEIEGLYGVTVSGPVPDVIASLPPGSSQFFRWEVDVEASGILDLEVPLTAMGIDGPLERTAIGTIDSYGFDVRIIYAPEDLDIDEFGTVRVEVSVDEVPMTVFVDPPAKIDGDGEFELFAEPWLGYLDQYESHTIDFIIRRTVEGDVGYEVVATATPDTTFYDRGDEDPDFSFYGPYLYDELTARDRGDLRAPLMLDAKTTHDVDGTPTTIESENDELAGEIYPGDVIELSGEGWDRDGPAIAITVDGEEVGTVDAAATFETSIELPLFLPRAASSEEACSATVTATQGEDFATVTVRGEIAGEVLAAEGATWANGDPVEVGQAFCEGDEPEVGASDVFIAKPAFASPKFSSGRTPDWDGLWIDAAGSGGRLRSRGGVLAYNVVIQRAGEFPLIVFSVGTAPSNRGLRIPYFNADVQQRSFTRDAKHPIILPDSPGQFVSAEARGFLHVTQLIDFTEVGSPKCVHDDVLTPFPDDVPIFSTAGTIVLDGPVIGAGRIVGYLNIYVADDIVMEGCPNTHLGPPVSIMVNTLIIGEPAFTIIGDTAPAGTKVLPIDIEGNFKVGDQMSIDPYGNNPQPGTMAGRGSLLLEDPLLYDVPAGTLVVNLTDPPGGSPFEVPDQDLFVGDAFVAEPADGTSAIVSVPVTLSAPLAYDVTIEFRTADDTAMADEDYVPVDFGEAVIPAGTTDAIIDLEVLGDGLVEEDETFLLEITLVDGVRLGDPDGLITIVSPDSPGEPPSVEIDVVPGTSHNVILANRFWLIPVAILGSETVDVAGVDVSSLAFGPDGATPLFRRALTFDANRDGHDDLVMLFRFARTGLPLGEGPACLTGVVDDEVFESCDDVDVRRRRR